MLTPPLPRAEMWAVGVCFIIRRFPAEFRGCVSTFTKLNSARVQRLVFIGKETHSRVKWELRKEEKLDFDLDYVE